MLNVNTLTMSVGLSNMSSVVHY